MPIPDFILELRSRIGTAPLWLPAVTAVVRDDRGRILLTRRADNGKWALVSGILDPGEEPAVAAVREVLEETGVHAEVVRLTSVDATPLISYPNGDRAQYLDVCFLLRATGGRARVADDENLDVAWFSPDEIPEPLTETSALRLAKALEDNAEAWFHRG